MIHSSLWHATRHVRAALVTLALITAPACSPGGHDGHADTTAGPEAGQTEAADPAAIGGNAVLGTLAIRGALVRPPPGGRDVTGGYVTITSSGPADRLVSASSPEARTIELHTHTHDGGMMKMRPVPSIEVPAGGSANLQPGGDHLMLFGVTPALSGPGPVPVTLVFETAGQVTVPFAVVPR